MGLDRLTLQRATQQALGRGLLDLVAKHVSCSVEDAGLSAELRQLLVERLKSPGRLLSPKKGYLPIALTLLAFATVSQREPKEIAPAAAAIELLMAAGDLIDDVQDAEGPDLSKATTSGELLEALAVLLMLCHQCFSELPGCGVPVSRVLRAVQVFDRQGLLALRGQDMDIRLERTHQVSIELALECTRLKSASLMRCAAEVGAVLATDDEEIIDMLASFGWHFGTVAQLMNDIQAVWPGSSGKSDLRLRKKTLPVVFSLSDQALSQESREIVRRYYDSPDGDGISEAEVKQAIWYCGGIHYAWYIAAEEKERARALAQKLSDLRPGPWSLDYFVA